MCRIRLFKGISKHQQLKYKFVITAPNTVHASVYTNKASSEPYGTTRQQATAKTHAKQSAYQILSLIVLVVV
jgi:hypothetical protein